MIRPERQSPPKPMSRTTSSVPGAHCLTNPHADRLRDAEREHECRCGTGDRDLVGRERRRANPAHQNRGERESADFG